MTNEYNYERASKGHNETSLWWYRHDEYANG
jgi:hypothetical protein